MDGVNLANRNVTLGWGYTRTRPCTQ